MGQGAAAEASEYDIARELSNPVGALISVPLQFNYDRGMGPAEDGQRYLLNIQPVVPFSLTPELNLISRIIIPVIDQKDAVPGGGSQSLARRHRAEPVFLAGETDRRRPHLRRVPGLSVPPTATDKRLGTEQWAIGPTGVVLRQDGPWTFGVLANHLWSVAGESNRASVNATFVQPFVTYVTQTRTTF